MRTHVAILKRLYIDSILKGEKNVECRLTHIPCPPFNCIAPGEIVFLKESAGPVRGRAHIDNVLSFDDLTPDGVHRICRDYNEQIMADADYWQSRLDCRYCTLIWLKNVRQIPPFRIKRKGLRAWIIYPNEKAIPKLSGAPVVISK